MILLFLLLQTPDLASLSRQGAQAIREGRYPDAERAYRQLQKLDPTNPAWHMNLGIAYHNAKRFSEAIPELQKYLKARPQPGPMYLLLGVSQLKLSRPCDAVGALEKAKLWNAEQTLVELADAYYGCRRYANAARTYEAVRPRTPALARQAAHCFWQARLYPDAQRLFATVASAFGEEAGFNYEYGDTLVRQSGPAEGVAYLEKAAALQPNLIGARAELGKALEALGRAAEAIPHLQTAAEADPVLLLPLSRAYRAIGKAADAEEAQAAYRRKVGQ
ncbi:MAG: tetratricopeptide repeat protein [Bryobacteraceae bacterium]|nr:tetratricopeptide repeat protein [Bryobacteraceae bacterium]